MAADILAHKGGGEKMDVHAYIVQQEDFFQQFSLLFHHFLWVDNDVVNRVVLDLDSQEDNLTENSI